MKTHIVLVVLISMLTACNQPALDHVSATSIPATPIHITQLVIPPTLSQDAILFGYPPLSGLLPYGLGVSTTATTTTDVDLSYVDLSLGYMPEHLRMEIWGYPFTRTNHQPRILVFNVAEYAQYSKSTQAVISSLQALNVESGGPLPKGLWTGVISSQIHPTQFISGSGVRYLTQMVDPAFPVNNRSLLYFFHGLTFDGRYYVSAYLPVSAPFLVADDNPASPLPPEAIPFNWEDPENQSGYFEAVSLQLNNAAPEIFHPNLTDLDALIRSLSINP